MPVGDNQGNVYRSSEGFGKAYILPESKAIQQLPDQLDSYFKIELEKEKAQLAQKQMQMQKDKTFAAALDKAKPEWWTRHDNEMRGEMQDTLNMAADIYAAGVDPFTSNDPTSVSFRDKLDRATTMGKLSMQWKDMYENDRKLINGKDGNLYDPSSVLTQKDFFDNTSLQKGLDEGLLPPYLKFKQPEVNIEELARKSAAGIKEGESAPEDYLRIGVAHLSDPTTKAQLAQYLGDLKANDPDNYNINIAMPAKEAGVTEDAYYMGELVRSYRPDKPIADVEKAILEKMKVGTTTTGYRSENDAGVTTSSKTTETPKETALAAGFYQANSNPGWVARKIKEGAEYYRLERDPKTKKIVEIGDPIKIVDKKTAGEFLGYLHWLQSDYSKESGRDVQFFDEITKLGIGDKKEVEKDRDLYEKMLRGKVTTWEELAGYGVQVGNKKGELSAEDIRRLQDWSANQAIGLKMSGDQDLVITGNYEEENPDTGEKRSYATGAGQTQGLDLLGRPVPERSPTMRFAKRYSAFDKSKNAVVESYDNVTFGLDEGMDNYLESGEIDDLYFGAIKGEGQKKAKELMVKALNRDLYEVFPESDAGGEGSSNYLFQSNKKFD